MTKKNELLQNPPQKGGGIIQWHPAFFADIQIELEEDAENLIFENEHQLSKKPMAIDVLIIKKVSEKPVKKNIGRIFRTYNIVEYKSPSDYLSADDFYKVYGYTCFYKADAGGAGGIGGAGRIGGVGTSGRAEISGAGTGSGKGIPAEELTITFVCTHFPREMLRQVERDRGIKAEEKEPGIYYLTGDAIPIQLLVTTQLSPESNLWLHSLTNSLEDTADAQNLVERYQAHKEDARYQAVMNAIVRANRVKFEEVRRMCDALKELFAEEFAEAELRGEARGEARGLAQGEARGEARGLAQGEARGLVKGEAHGLARINRLILKLSEQGREADIVRAAKDENFQQELLAEYGL